MKQGKRLVIAGLLAVLLLLGAGIVVFILTRPNDASVSSQVLEKGGQIELPTTTPQPTGPVEPTLPPTIISRAQPSPTSATVRTQPSPTAFSTNPISTPTPTPNLNKGIIPWKIRIPALKIDTYVERVGVTREGLMDVPKNIWNTAWFGEGGYRPGDRGNAVIAGHLDAPGTKAIFWDLDKLKPGDQIFLNDAAGRELVFEVQKREVYPVDNAPLIDIFGPSSEARLNLITCNGTFDRTIRNYNKRLVVFSRLVQ